MSYNKAKAEKEWLKWKEAEEKKLRELGVDENTIQRLHTYDWEEFNRERRYFQRHTEWSSQLETMCSTLDVEIPVESVETMLNNIENQTLYSILCDTDELTLNILMLKILGYSNKEIAKELDISSNAVTLRLFRLKQKLKKYL